MKVDKMNLLGFSPLPYCSFVMIDDNTQIRFHSFFEGGISPF